MPLCNGCSNKISLLNREKTCPTCRMTFCTRCLTEDSTGHKFHFCKSNQPYDPPSALVKRLQQLEDPSRPPVTMIINNGPPLNSRGLDQKDLHLFQRLEKLRETKENIPTEDQIRARLEALRGTQNNLSACAGYGGMPNVPTTGGVMPSAVRFPPGLSEQEQVDALLAQYMASASIDTRTHHHVDSDDENGHDSAVDAIMKQAMEEASLPDTDGVALSPPPSPPADMEELPWCELCNGDASLRCLTCDFALYCRRCYRETHTGSDSDHESQPYP